MSSAELSTLSRLFESYLASNQPAGQPESLYLPIRYMNDLGGKRIRPVLTLMAYRMFHPDVTPALPVAMAVEYFHNFSLMHDDIMDEAPLRRGKQTVHEVFGRNAAILSGDAMLIRCFELLLEAGRSDGTGALLCELMSRASIEICEGQQMDMDFEALNVPSASDYMEMIRKKTACLIGTSLRLGAVLAGAERQQADVLYRFGESAGMGFQIRDDYLDVFGDAAETGKVVGGDILRGKKNFLFVCACEQLKEHERDAFLQTYHQAAVSGDIRHVISVYQKMGLDKYVLRVQNDFQEKAHEALSAIGDLPVESLKQFAESLVGRSS